MRKLLVLAALGTAWSVGSAQVQYTEGQRTPKKHAGTAADALVENGPERPHALDDVNREAAERKTKVEKSNDATTAAEKQAAPPAPAITVQAVPPGPPQKNLTGEEFRLIHPGSTDKEVLSVLGPPSSRIVVPDDDGHLRETFQYWVKGSPMGTVRFDNGHVTQIEAKQK